MATCRHRHSLRLLLRHALRQGLQDSLRQAAAKGLDDHVAKFIRTRPAVNLNLGSCPSRQPLQRARVVDHQVHFLPAATQRAGQSPAHAYVTQVVDDAAINVPALPA